LAYFTGVGTSICPSVMHVQMPKVGQASGYVGQASGYLRKQITKIFTRKIPSESYKHVTGLLKLPTLDPP